MFLAVDNALFDGFDDVVHRNNRIHVNAVFRLCHLNSRQVGIQRLFHTVHRDNHPYDFHVCSRSKLGQDFTKGLTTGHNVFDDDDLFAVHKLFTNKQAAFAVVLHFLSIEAIIQFLSVMVKERNRRRNRKGDSLVCRANQRFRLQAVLRDARRIIFPKLGKLFARLVVARVDEVGSFSTTLQREFPKAQYAVFYHETNKLLFIIEFHNQITPFYYL